MVNWHLTITLLVVITSSCGGGSPVPDPDPVIENTNPVFTPVFADPTVLDNRSRDGYFYAYATQDKWERVATSIHIVPIIRSTDLVNWEFVGDVFSEQPTWNIDENQVWAPDIEYRNGQYFLYYSLSKWGASNSAIGVTVSDSPVGPFTDLGKVLDSNGSGVANSIDPYYFKDSDGKEYLFWGSFHGIYGVPLEADGKTVRLEEKFQIAGTAFEAAYIFSKDGYYYLMASVGSCCDGDYSYHVTIARSQTLSGPYLDVNGKDVNEVYSWQYGEDDKSVNVLYRSRDVVAPGHNSEIITDDEGTEWILYHAIEVPDYTLPGGGPKRPLFIDKVTWNEDGWPKIGNGGTPTTGEIELPSIN
ncbi:MAG: family 43 glycosylhydrolase [Bacteroidota bacterium]